MTEDAQGPALTIVAPMAGEVVDLADVPDPVFSAKKMGDGAGVRPTGDQIVAPADGKVIMVAKTGHAIGIKTPSGLDLLLHLGIDTVQLEGRPFALTVKTGDQITAGQPIGTMNLAEVVAAGKDTTAIIIVTNSKKMEALSLDLGPAAIGQPIAEARVKVAASAPVPVAAGAAASPAPAVVEEVDDGLTGFDALARDIIKNIGGPDNVRSVLHCITRVRFYLKDEAQANDEVVANLDGVIDVAKAGGQYQVVIGPAVEDVYEAVVKQLPQIDSDAGAAAEAVEKPTTLVGWLKFGFSSLIGVIDGSMIPVIGLLAAAGIL